MPRTLLPIISLAAIISAGATIAAEYIRPIRPWLVYLFKPLTTVLILVAALLPGTFLAERYAGAICLGLVFSLMGDIWLMLPGDHFLRGLASFFAAHVCYAIAFLAGAAAGGYVWFLLGLGVIGALILRFLWPGLRASLKLPVVAYLFVIVLMVSLAVGLAAAGPSAAATSAAVGALLFMTSDSILAIDRFRRPFRLAQALVLGTYFLGQLLIALSVGLRVLRLA